MEEAEEGVPDCDSGKRTLGTSTGSLEVRLVVEEAVVVAATTAEEAMAAEAAEVKEALQVLHQDVFQRIRLGRSTPRNLRTELRRMRAHSRELEWGTDRLGRLYNRIDEGQCLASFGRSSFGNPRSHHTLRHKLHSAPRKLQSRCSRDGLQGIVCRLDTRRR